MLKPGILTKVRKWLTADKTITQEGKWFADAKSIKDLTDAVRRIVPIGTIISLMGNNAPTDYLKCDGTTYNIADYSDLADYFYAQFGSKNYFGGDGSTTFKVPDLRGEFLRGTGSNGHSNEGSGANVGVHQAGTESPRVESWGSDIRLYIPTTDNSNYPVNIDKKLAPSSGQKFKKVTATIVDESSGSTNNEYRYKIRPTNTSILYCIKYI